MWSKDKPEAKLSIFNPNNVFALFVWEWVHVGQYVALTSIAKNIYFWTFNIDNLSHKTIQADPEMIV